MKTGDIVRIAPRGDEYDNQIAEILEIEDNYLARVILFSDGGEGDFPIIDLKILPPLSQLAAAAE